MDFAFTEEQHLIRKSALGLAATFDMVGWARRGANREEQETLWRGLCEAGFVGALASQPEVDGELGFVELGILSEVFGACLSPVPFANAAAITADLLRELPDSDTRANLIKDLAGGERTILTLLSWSNTERISGTHEKVLNASFAPVPGAEGAQEFIVPVPDETQNHGYDLWLVPARTNGCTIENVPLLDLSRTWSSIVLKDIPLKAAQHIGKIDKRSYRRRQAVGCAMLSAEMLGGAQRLLDLACAYAKQRQQFGQAIGSFQAIKHLLADDAVLVEGLRSLTYGALGALDRTVLPPDCWASKAHASEIYIKVASDTIQVFGAMGYSAETEPHLYLKRAQADLLAFASPAKCHQQIEEFLFCNEGRKRSLAQAREITPPTLLEAVAK